jgi:hypothetical protein
MPQRIVGASFGSGNEVAVRFGCFTLPDYLIELDRETFKYDLSPINCAPSWTVPVPGRYVLDTDAVVAYADVKPDYTAGPARSAAAGAFSDEKSAAE